MWSPFSSNPPAPEPKSSESSSEFLEDPFADPFAEDDEGAAFGSISLPPPTPDIIVETPPPISGETPVPSNVKVDMQTLLGAGRISPAIQNSLIAAGKQKSAKDAAYLRFKRRSVYERAMYNTGCAYLLGVVAGGAYGVVEGFFRMPGQRMKIRLNGMLNGGGRRGAMLGNAAGVITMMFSFCEGGLDDLDVERHLQQLGLPRNDLTTPMLAAGLAGMAYRVPAALSSGRNGLLMLLTTGVLSMGAITGLTYVAPLVSEHMPFSR